LPRSVNWTGAAYFQRGEGVAKVNVYIDGFNLYYGALGELRTNGSIWLAFAKLSFPLTPFKKSSTSLQE
jgi:hypothetical protein